MFRGIVYRGRAGLAVMLSTRDRHGDRYESWYELPIDAHSFSTERKLVHTGEGRQLERFFAEPVHTGPDPSFPPTHVLPSWLHDAVETFIVGEGRRNRGYAIELVGIGEPSVSWVLQRLEGRRAMRFHPVGPVTGWDEERVRQLADQMQVAYWRHDVHFVLRLNGFESEDAMSAWVGQHQRTREPIARHLPPLFSRPADGTDATPWFESMGAYAPPCALDLDDAAAEFAFRELSNWALLRAYWSRGPANPILNFLNWPIEAYHLHWNQCPAGTVLTRFGCDLRFEVYG